MRLVCFLFQAEDGIRDLVRSRGLGDVYKRQVVSDAPVLVPRALTWREDRLMVIDATRAYTLDSSTGQWQAQSLSTPDTAGYVNTIAAEAFDGNLYLLMPADGKIPVSYTHLTLPTSDLV